MQGEITSPILFSLFVNDIELSLQYNINAGLSLEELCIYLLLFADDAELMSETREGLQMSLIQLEEYCLKWNLYVNVEKTKIMIFRKGGVLNKLDKWFYAGNDIEIVNSFNYLGVVFSSGGSFNNTTKTTVDKGLRALMSLFNITKGLEIPVSIMHNLFDTYVLSVLNYGCEIWGYIKAENVERVHRKYCKRLLGVKNSTNNLAVYSELGRFPLYIKRHTRIIKYWLQLFNEKKDNCILKNVMMYRRKLVNNIKCDNWSYKVRYILESAGFAEVWMYPESVNTNVFLPVLLLRLQDMYISNWRRDMNLCSSLFLYKELKVDFTIAEYLQRLNNFKLRNVISKIRLSSHNLFIETGRHMNIARNQRKCSKCRLNEIQDEYHFILVCPYFIDLRNTFISNYFTQNPSMYKFLQLLNSNKRKEIINLANFCIKAFKKLEQT